MYKLLLMPLEREVSRKPFHLPAVSLLAAPNLSIHSCNQQIMNSNYMSIIMLRPENTKTNDILPSLKGLLALSKTASSERQSGLMANGMNPRICQA